MTTVKETETPAMKGRGDEVQLRRPYEERLAVDRGWSSIKIWEDDPVATASGLLRRRYARSGPSQYV